MHHFVLLNPPPEPPSEAFGGLMAAAGGQGPPGSLAPWAGQEQLATGSAAGSPSGVTCCPVRGPLGKLRSADPEVGAGLRRGSRQLPNAGACSFSNKCRRRQRLLGE